MDIFSILKQTIKKEEQYRFSLLIEHMDIPILEHDLEAWGAPEA